MIVRDMVKALKTRSLASTDQILLTIPAGATPGLYTIRLVRTPVELTVDGARRGRRMVLTFVPDKMIGAPVVEKVADVKDEKHG